jgi:tetratricopeptide (TPR) repeat protein
MSLKLRCQAIVAAVMALAAAVGVTAQVAASNEVFRLRAQQEFFRTQAQFQSAPDNPTNVWNFGRASFEYCEVITNATRRAEVARAGISACRHLLARESNSVPGHYFLGINLGELADAEAPSFTAYRLVYEVEKEFQTTAALDKHFEYAGALRNLGELYFQAPGWPVSVGSKHKAREALERAVALAPDYPENQINLAEAQLKWREAQAFAATMRNLAAHWPAAQTNFTGVAWETAWSDWNTRRAVLTAEFQKNFKRVP